MKRIRDLFEYALYKFTLYLLTYLLTCHPTQVNLSHLNLSQTGQSSIYLPHRDEGLSLTWMVGYILRWVTFVQAVTHCLR